MDKKGIRFLTVSNNLITRNLSLLISAIIMIVSLILLPGCGTTTTLKDASSSGESTDVKLLKPQSLPVYYDFEDISIPPELTLDKEKSFIYETSALKTGILVFKGRIDVSSLVAFFQENMKKNNWVFINSFKYKGYILNFQKEDKSCLITLYDRAFNTIVEVRVGPLHGTVEKPK
jgi:hypothetical protein